VDFGLWKQLGGYGAGAGGAGSAKGIAIVFSLLKFSKNMAASVG